MVSHIISLAVEWIRIAMISTGEQELDVASGGYLNIEL